MESTQRGPLKGIPTSPREGPDQSAVPSRLGPQGAGTRTKGQTRPSTEPARSSARVMHEALEAQKHELQQSLPVRPPKAARSPSSGLENQAGLGGRTTTQQMPPTCSAVRLNSSHQPELQPHPWGEFRSAGILQRPPLSKTRNLQLAAFHNP